MKLSNFSRDRSSIALIITSILSVILFSYNDSDFINFLNTKWGEAKKIILKPKSDLDAFLVYKDVFKKQIIENIQVKLSSNYNHFPRCESIDEALKSFDNFENKKIKGKQSNLKSNEWVFGNIFSYPKTQLSNSVLIDVGADDFENLRKRRYIVLDINGNLVGRIIRLGNKSSKVQLINDKKNEIMVENFSNSLNSALMVPISYKKAELYGVTSQDNLLVGDTLYTSSNSAVYIPRIPVSIVTKIIEPKNKEPFKKVIVETISNIKNLNFAVVIATDKIIN